MLSRVRSSPSSVKALLWKSSKSSPYPCRDEPRMAGASQRSGVQTSKSLQLASAGQFKALGQLIGHS
eukprot:11965947-Heterocapsa_arctica.AAC.1